ncbi:hypothetical protein RRG08_055263 [Elysia crispata]|uniref:Uncharacterized protein n=1 Tax=Elysia crispata TaxID=231223 RepID=A0AAE0ZW79_9GAST|nr:hypothetical protein RRG08_055263 [Elysia crispata]
MTPLGAGQHLGHAPGDGYSLTWEILLVCRGNFQSSDCLNPIASGTEQTPRRLIDEAWQVYSEVKTA